jgi:hypothetical protein
MARDPQCYGSAPVSCGARWFRHVEDLVKQYEQRTGIKVAYRTD